MTNPEFTDSLFEEWSLRGPVVVSSPRGAFDRGLLPFDFKRDVFVDNCVPFLNVFANNALASKAFCRLAQRNSVQGKAATFKIKHGVALSPEHKQYMAVLGYMYSLDEVPRKLAGQCLSISAASLFRRRSVWTGDLVRKREDVSAKLDEFFQNAPGYRVGDLGFLLHTSLPKP